MRTLKTFLLAFALVLVATLAHAQTILTDPVKYNDFIVQQQNNIGKEILVFNEIISADPDLADRSKVDAQLKVIQKACNDGLNNVKGLRGQHDDMGLKQSAISLFEFYASIFENEYKQMIDLLYSENPNMETMNSILASVSEKEGPIDLKFQKAQQRFAKENNFELTENELQKELDETTE